RRELLPGDRPGDVGHPRARLEDDRVEFDQLAAPKIRRAAEQAKAAKMQPRKLLVTPAGVFEIRLRLGVDATPARLEHNHPVPGAGELDRHGEPDGARPD